MSLRCADSSLLWSICTIALTSNTATGSPFCSEYLQVEGGGSEMMHTPTQVLCLAHSRGGGGK
jgi:hypothetical protein